MATITRFEDLEIWQKARILTKRVFVLSKKENFSLDYRLRIRYFHLLARLWITLPKVLRGEEMLSSGNFSLSRKVQQAKLVPSFIALSISSIFHRKSLKNCFLNMKAYPEKLKIS